MRSFTGINQSFNPNERAGNSNSNGKSPRFNFLIFILALILLVLGQKGYSQTNTYSGGGGNIWSNASKWSLGHIPTAVEDAVIQNKKSESAFVLFGAILEIVQNFISILVNLLQTYFWVQLNS